MARHGRTFPIVSHRNYQGKLGIYFYRSLSKTISETVVVTDSVAKIVGRYLAETIPVFDSITSTITRTAILVETVVVTDIKAITKAVIILTETLLFTDLIGFAKRARDFIMGRNNDSGIKVGRSI